MNNPHYFLYIGLLLVAIIGGWYWIIRWRDHMRQQVSVSTDDTINPPSADDDDPDPDPEPVIIRVVIRPAKPCRWQRKRTSHGPRMFPC